MFVHLESIAVQDPDVIRLDSIISTCRAILSGSQRSSEAIMEMYFPFAAAKARSATCRFPGFCGGG